MCDVWTGFLWGLLSAWLLLGMTAWFEIDYWLSRKEHERRVRAARRRQEERRLYFNKGKQHA